MALTGWTLWLRYWWRPSLAYLQQHPIASTPHRARDLHHPWHPDKTRNHSAWISIYTILSRMTRHSLVSSGQTAWNKHKKVYSPALLEIDADIEVLVDDVLEHARDGLVVPLRRQHLVQHLARLLEVAHPAQLCVRQTSPCHGHQCMLNGEPSSRSLSARWRPRRRLLFYGCNTPQIP
jgi:hypothetical protein